jgi:hypothetical protein
MAHPLDDRDVVRDEEIGKAHTRLKVEHQIDHLCLDRDVERRNRLVGNNQLGPKRKRAGDADALPLTTGKLMRKARSHVCRQPDTNQQIGNPVARLR